MSLFVSLVQVPRVFVVKKTVEDPQFEIVQRPRRFRARTCWSHRVQVVAETTEIPQLQVVEKIGEIPEDFPVCIPREDSAAEQDFACRQEDACEESS